MTLDERVRDALHAYADPIEPTPGSWDRIEARLDERLPRPRGSRTPLLVGAVGILVIVAMLGAALVRDLNDESNVTVDGGVAAPMPGQMVAVTTTGRVVTLDSETGKILDTRAVAGTSSGEQVVPSADGRALYFGPRGFDRSCSERSLSQLTLDGPVRSVDPVAARSLAPAPSPDGKYLAYLRCSPGSAEPDEIVLRDLATNGEQVTQVPAGSTLSGSLAFAGDSRHVLVGVGSGLHRLDLVGGQALPGEKFGIASWAVPRGLRADQYLLLQNSPPDVQVVRGPQPFTAHRLFQLPAAANPVVSDASGDHVLATTVDGSLYRWSVGDQAPTKIADGIETAAWIPGSRRPEPKPEPEAAMPPPQRVLVFGTTARGGPSMVLLPSASQGGEGEMQGVSNVVAGSPVAVVPGTRVAYVVRKSVSSTCGDGHAIFRQPIASGVRDGEEITNATAPAVSPDGRYLGYLACRTNGDGPWLTLRDLQTGAEDSTFVAVDYDAARLQFSPDSSRLLVASTRQPAMAEVDVVDGRLRGSGSTRPAAASIAGYWGEDELVAIDRSSPVARVIALPGAGGAGRTLFEPRDLDGTVTTVIPNLSGTALLVVVDDSKLFWWAPGMVNPSLLDAKMLTAAWMPDAPPAQTTDALPIGIVAVRNNELVVLGFADRAQHSSLGAVEPGTSVAPSADGRDWILGGSTAPPRCDHSGARTQPALQRLDTSSERRDDWVGGGYSPVTNREDVVAYGYACDGNGLGLSSLRTERNYRVDPIPRSSEASRIGGVRPLGWAPDGRTLLYSVDVGSESRLLAARFAPAFYDGARSRDVDITELGTPALRTATMSGNQTAVGARSDAPTFLVEYRLAGGLREPHRLTELPEPVTSIVADPSGKHFLIVTSGNELWRWSRGQTGPAAVADGVTAAAWLPWS